MSEVNVVPKPAKSAVRFTINGWQNKLKEEGQGNEIYVSLKNSD